MWILGPAALLDLSFSKTTLVKQSPLTASATVGWMMTALFWPEFEDVSVNVHIMCHQQDRATIIQDGHSAATISRFGYLSQR